MKKKLKKIETLEKDNGNGQDQFRKEKTLLKTAMSNFFSIQPKNP